MKRREVPEKNKLLKKEKKLQKTKNQNQKRNV